MRPDVARTLAHRCRVLSGVLKEGGGRGYYAHPLSRYWLGELGRHVGGVRQLCCQCDTESGLRRLGSHLGAVHGLMLFHVDQSIQIANWVAKEERGLATLNVVGVHLTIMRQVVQEASDG